MKPTPFFFRLARRHGSRRFRQNRCVDSTQATRCFPPPESPTTRMPGHPPPCLAILNWRMSTMPINVLFGRGSDNSNACRATSYSGWVRIIRYFENPARESPTSRLSPCPRGTHQSSLAASMVASLSESEE